MLTPTTKPVEVLIVFEISIIAIIWKTFKVANIRIIYMFQRNATMLYRYLTTSQFH